MHRFFARVTHEIRALLPVWMFFFLTFSLLRLTQSVIIRQYGLHSTTPSLVLLGSLIVAKTFLVLDLFSFVERFSGKPLIFGVLWKTGIYFCGAFFIYFAEQLIELTIRHRSVSMAWHQVSTVAGTYHFWIVELWLVLLLFVYTGTRETMRTFGKQRFMDVWFGSRRPSRLFQRKKAA